MCLIIACPPGKTPDLDRVIDATWDNPNGSGFMVRTPRGLEIVRSAEDVQSVYDAFVDACDRWPSAWRVWHSRLSTQGYDCDDNTHPFRVPGRPWAIAHNGVLPLNDGPFDQRDRSDSRILAEDILSEATWAQLVGERERITRWLGGDKVVVLSEHKERGGPCLILGESHGTWDQGDGCWYSRRSQPMACHVCGSGSYRRCTCPKRYVYNTTTTWATKEPAALTSGAIDNDPWWEEQELAEEAELAALAADGHEGAAAYIRAFAPWEDAN